MTANQDKNFMKVNEYDVKQQINNSMEVLNEVTKDGLLYYILHVTQQSSVLTHPTAMLLVILTMMLAVSDTRAVILLSFDINGSFLALNEIL